MPKVIPKGVAVAIVTVLVATLIIYPALKAEMETTQPPPPHNAQARILLEDDGSLNFYEKPKETASEVELRAYVTGYNTVAEQTDSTPCDATGGYICGRDDVVACPRELPLYSWVEISGKEYQCMDRTAKKHDGRFDISCDKDKACPARITGWYNVRVLD